MTACPRCGHENPQGARFCNSCAAPLAEAAPERRKLATLLFCDVTGSTRLGETADAETVRELMFRYFHAMRGCIERRGGTVEKFVGDAVMAVFGVPVAHEDDALRACEAALQMQARLEELNADFRFRYDSVLAVRVGIATGEVVAGDASSRETFVTGDAVNVASRLEQAATPGDILLSADTYRLVAGRVEAEPVEPVAAKGKAEPVAAYRLVSDARGVSPAPGRALLVGREQELATLLRAVAEMTGERRSRVVKLVGEPGVGKTRLAEELEHQVAPQLQVLRGRCLSYGEGITFWPIAEIVRQAARILDEHRPEQARARIDRLAGDERVGGLVAQAIGVGSGAAAGEEIAWAIRSLLAALARQRPLLLILDDLQWGEPELLDLVESLTERPLDEPVLVVGLARPELEDARPDWRDVIRLHPLPNAAAAALAAGLDEAARSAVLARAGGNPLFLGELTALVRETGDTEGLPRTLSALLGARLDRLEERQRAVLERASIEGEVFHRGGVVALSDSEGVPDQLRSLAQREVIRSARAHYRDEAAFRFHHILVRDAAYAAIAKRLRAELHERFADWLERVVGDRVTEYEEILGYHLEQAFRYREELGPADDCRRALADRAADLLFAAGRRAEDRGDVSAGANLLQRAADLTVPDSPNRAWRLLRLGDILFSAGEFERMDAAFLEAEERAAAAGDRRTEVFARLDRIRYAVERAAPRFTSEDARVAAEAALPVFAEFGDELGLSEAWMVLGDCHRLRFEMAPWQDAYEQAILHARRSGDRRQLGMALARFGGPLSWGPTPVDDVIRRFERELVERDVPMQPRVVWQAMLGELEAMRGNVELGRELYRDARVSVEELGNAIAIVVVISCALGVEELAGDLPAAEAHARDALTRLESMGHGWAAGYRLELAYYVARQGRSAEAESLLNEIQPSDDPEELALRAWILSARGAQIEAERLARTAVERLSQSDVLQKRARAHQILADVLVASGAAAEAVAELEEASRIWELKGAVLPAERARARAAELRES